LNLPGIPGTRNHGLPLRIAVFAIDGTFARDPRTVRTIEAMAEMPFGVAKGSARVSVENAALSLAFDPRRVAFGAIQRILDRKLAALRLSLLPMSLID
jgi:hypothetical protein